MENVIKSAVGIAWKTLLSLDSGIVVWTFGFKYF